jgi:phosphate/sulfate permease
MIFIIALLQIPPVLETVVPYVLVWVVSFYVLNQYHEKNKKRISKNQRWKLIFLITIAALLIGLTFSYPIHSADMARDIQRLLFGVLFALPAYAVLVWSAEYRATKRLLENYPELKSKQPSSPQSEFK